MHNARIKFKEIFQSRLAKALLVLSSAMPANAQQDQQQQIQKSTQKQQYQAQRQKSGAQKVQRSKATGSTQQESSSKKSPRYSANGSSASGDESTAPSHEVRQFHEVLNDLLSEFAYDVKQGQINGLKNLAIRRVDISDTLPRTYEQYVELLVTERIRENSKVKLINCISCKTKSSTMVDGKLMISSPLTNIQKMDEAANQLGIENFMDVVLVYHTTHMVLAFNVFSTQTKELVWARTYNSETLRSRYQRMAVDFNQIEKSRTSDEYIPEYKFLVGMGASQLPNVAGTQRDKSFIAAHVRAGEKFDNRRVDFGLLASFYSSTSAFLKTYPSEGTSSSTTSTAYSGTARAVAYKYVLGLHAMTAVNFIGDVEVYDKIRQGIHLGIGGVIGTGYLAPSAKLGWDLYFGRRFVLTFAGHYIMQSSILVKNEYQTARGGGGGDFVLSYNF